MSTTGLPTFDHTIQATNIWLRELAEAMGWGDDRQRTYNALRAVLHALRDNMSLAEAADLSAQLPLLIRGVFFEGWRPAGKSKPERKLQHFLARVESAFPHDVLVNAEEITSAVFALVSRHVSAGEVNDVKNCLPKHIRSLWPKNRPADDRVFATK
ncbi:MAG TPA: DUF2267 domain-containing protein [Tepidisphaeraceae bacterium]|nr:DUF2267 domain-containing protein [Tepidisphaeraceae bacterium]